MKLANCYAGDFETTTDENDLRVWAYALCNVDDYHEFHYGTSIEEFFEFIMNENRNLKIWFHNLRFDGSYIISYLFFHGFHYAETVKDIKSHTFTTLITDMGQFYNITVYFNIKGHKTKKVEFFDSMKIFPNFSVERIADGFKLPISKLKINYRAKREIGHQLTEAEIAYIRNDVEIVARALKEMFSRGLTKMTIASDAINNFRDHFVGFRKKFPLLDEPTDQEIRASYRGGFTYVNEIYQGKEVGKGIVLDVNSLYPSVMVQKPMPYGTPLFFEGKYEEDINYPLYIQSILCCFRLKPGKIPCIQLKNSMSFRSNEYLKSSNDEVINLNLTRPDFELFMEQYDVYNIEYRGGWKFKSSIGLFDDYINYWTEQKIKAGKEKNASLRQISKLMLNSLYGKYATSNKGKIKIPMLDENGVLRYITTEGDERQIIYTAVASYVTSWGRNKTIKTSQAIRDFTLNKYGEDRYYYSDTDSCHANLNDEDLEELKDIIQIDDYKLGCWAKEAEFTRAKYLRQKCYIEEIDGKVNVTVAGLPKYLAPLVNFDNFDIGFSTTGLTEEMMKQLAKANGATEEEIEKLHHKLTYKYVKGGVILADTDFTIK